MPQSHRVNASSDQLLCFVQHLCVISVNSRCLNLETQTHGQTGGPSHQVCHIGVFLVSWRKTVKKPCSENPSMMADFTHDCFLTLGLMMEVMHAGNSFLSYVRVKECTHLARDQPQVPLLRNHPPCSLSQRLSPGPAVCSFSEAGCQEPQGCSCLWDYRCVFPFIWALGPNSGVLYPKSHHLWGVLFKARIHLIGSFGEAGREGETSSSPKDAVCLFWEGHRNSFTHLIL